MNGKSDRQFIADAVDGEEAFGGAFVVGEFLAQLNDHLVEGAGRAVVIIAPDFVE